MKNIGLMAALVVGVLLLGIGTASATTTGFELHKAVTVKGDWEWTTHWEKTYPTTAGYTYDVYSPTALHTSAMNYDDLGTAWKYTGHTLVQTDAPTDYFNAFHAWTVNDPATTPATGGYTQFNFGEHTVSTDPNAASTVDLVAFGQGYFDLNSHVVTDAGSQQAVDVTVN